MLADWRLDNYWLGLRRRASSTGHALLPSQRGHIVRRLFPRIQPAALQNSDVLPALRFEFLGETLCGSNLKGSKRTAIVTGNS